jgi:hypothetical protein
MSNRHQPARQRGARERGPPGGARSNGVNDELAGLLEAGDHRAATARARQVLSDPAVNAKDRDVALATLARVKPGRAVALVAMAGLGLLVAATIFGLLRT